MFIRLFTKNQPIWVKFEKITSIRENTRQEPVSITVVCDNTTELVSNESAANFFDRLELALKDSPYHGLILDEEDFTS